MSGKRRAKTANPLPLRPAPPVLRGPRVTLRPPVAADADAARRIGLHPEIERQFGAQPEPEWRELTPDEAQGLLVTLASADGRVTWVVDAGDGFIGSASLHSFSADDRTAAYAIGLLDPDVLGRGLGTEITKLVLAYAFDELGLQELTVRVLEFNERAVRCYTRCGFVLDHREPDAVVFDGVSHADLIMRLDAARHHDLAAERGEATEPPSPQAARLSPTAVGNRSCSIPGSSALTAPASSELRRMMRMRGTPAPRRVGAGAAVNMGVAMSEFGRQDPDAGKTGVESHVGRTSAIGGGALGPPRLSASVMSAANEGSQGTRRPWAWALGFVAVIVIVIGVLILILR
jgi:[ribosomal protein S5]-alanine N-acetyltransferase